MRSDAMRANTCLHERDDFALEPREIGVHREDDEKEQCDLDQREHQKPRRSGQGTIQFCNKTTHDLACASGTDSMVVRNLLSVPLVKSVSFAERIRPTGTS